jgi:arylsulfatase A-like enzyme
MKNSFLLYFFVIVVIAGGCRDQAGNKKLPNIIFVVVDDLGWRDVGFMGSEFYDTPNIDRLAGEGMTFTNGYAACAVCSPTRASILTGRYPARIGITDWIRGRYSGFKVPEDKKYPDGYDSNPNRALLTPKNPHWLKHSEVTIAEMLKQKGYTTGHIGKWHLGPDEWLPTSQGFDVNIGGEDYGQPPVYFDPYKRGKFYIETLPPRRKGEYLTDREGDEAVKFIRQNKDKPFFLDLWHYAVHTPLQAKKNYIENAKKRAVSLGIDPLGPDEDAGGIFRTKIPLHGQRNPTYAAMIKSVDEAMGKVLSALDSLGIRDNTIVVFFSDNGGHIVSTDNSPLRMGKGFPYEGGIREPLIISYPGITDEGSSCDVPVSSIDFFPTVCSWLNIDIPDSLVIDGKDISPLLKGEYDLGREDLFWHFPHYWWGQNVRPYSIVRSGDWKLIKHYEGGEELYNLKEDISETNNLAESNPEKRKELENKLDNWLKIVDAKLPLPNPEYKKE